VHSQNKLTEDLGLLKNKELLFSIKHGLFNLVKWIWTYKESPCSIVLDESLRTMAENRDEAKECISLSALRATKCSEGRSRKRFVSNNGFTAMGRH
jgi:hypothetical protein